MDNAALGAAVSIGTFTAIALIPRASSGQAEQMEALSLIYQAAPAIGCPSEQKFQAEVSKLTSRARFVQQPEGRRIRIELDSRGQEVVGRFISGEPGEQSLREVHGRDCPEVSSALAIAVALTIDPESTLSAAAGQAEKNDTSAAPPVASRPAPGPARTPERAMRAANVRLGVAAALALETAWSPEVRAGGGLALLVGFGPRLTLAAGATRFPSSERDQIAFGAWTCHGAVSWSIAELGIAQPFLAAWYEAGLIEASGAQLPQAGWSERPWHAAGLALGLRIETPGVFFELSGGALFPTSRQRYLVSDSVGQLRTLFETPGVGVKQETRLGVFL